LGRETARDSEDDSQQGTQDTVDFNDRDSHLSFLMSPMKRPKLEKRLTEMKDNASEADEQQECLEDEMMIDDVDADLDSLCNQLDRKSSDELNHGLAEPAIASNNFAFFKGP